jgi:hypothetical protein
MALSEGGAQMSPSQRFSLNAIVKTINNRIFVPLQNKGTDDFKSKRRAWEQALDRGQSLVDLSEKEWLMAQHSLHSDDHLAFDRMFEEYRRSFMRSERESEKSGYCTDYHKRQQSDCD